MRLDLTTLKAASDRMPAKSPYLLSRRKALAGLAATAACLSAGRQCVAAEPALSGATAENCAGPTFSQTGPDAQLYGAAEGYPIPDVVRARSQGSPWEPKYRVGAFSHLDEIYPT